MRYTKLTEEIARQHYMEGDTYIGPSVDYLEPLVAGVVKMKPFNLEKALAGEPVVTRSGTPVIEIHHFAKVEDSDFSVYAIVDGYVRSFTKRGAYCLGVEHEYDLFMAPAKRTMWGIMYRDCADDNGKLYLHPFLYPTEENARSEMERPINAAKKAIKVFPIEWEE